MTTGLVYLASLPCRTIWHREHLRRGRPLTVTVMASCQFGHHMLGLSLHGVVSEQGPFAAPVIRKPLTVMVSCHLSYRMLGAGHGRPSPGGRGGFGGNPSPYRRTSLVRLASHIRAPRRSEWGDRWIKCFLLVHDIGRFVCSVTQCSYGVVGLRYERHHALRRFASVKVL
jgi:hypothetical protein